MMVNIECYVNEVKDDELTISPKEQEEIEKNLGEKVQTIKVNASTDTMKMEVMVNGKKAPRTVAEIIENIVLTACE